MKNIKLTLLDSEDNVLKQSEDEQKVFLDPHHPYALGDKIKLKVDSVPTFVVVQFDRTLLPAMIYLTEKEWVYKIPFNIQREWPFSEYCFLGKNHYLTARFATNTEVEEYRNIAMNSHDQHDENSDAFPHVQSNAETRGEAVFYAQNAIDGILANEGHGNYPYQSWGINERDDAELRIDFGRQVTIDKIGLVLRADYPHDSYWTEATVEFSDNSYEKIYPQKLKKEQYFSFESRTIEWLILKKLIKDKDVSTFPALTEIEVFGK